MLDGNAFMNIQLILPYGSENLAARDDDPSFPFIEKIDLRTETHEFIEDKQEYLLRISPTTGAVRKAQKNLYRALDQQLDLQTSDYVCELSYDIQKDWAELWQLYRIINIYKKQDSLFKVIELLYSDNMVEFDFREVLKLKNEQQDLKQKIKEIEKTTGVIIDFYDIGNYTLDFKDKVPIEQLMLLIDSRIDMPVLQSTEEIEYELKINKLEQDLEKAENRKYLDFIQMRYNGPHSDPYAEKLSFGVGITIPNSGNYRLNIKELEIEEIQLKKEKQIEQTEHNREVKRLLYRIRGDFQLYRESLQSFAQEQADLLSSRAELTRMEPFDIESFKFIEEQLIKLELDELKATYELNLKIIKYFKDTEYICQNPNKQILFN
jgi:hypothetical protein